MRRWFFVMFASLALALHGCGSEDLLSSDAPAIDAANPPGPGTSTFTLEHGGLNRAYVVHVPSAYESGTPAPLLMAFHGNGGMADAFLSETDLTALADEEGLILVYPQGSLLEGESTHWNPLPPSDDNKSSTDDLGFVAALLDTLIATFNVDTDRVYACGYSNGGFMTYGLACAMSDRFAAVGDASGTMITAPEDCAPSHPTPVITFHGTDDSVVPYEGSEHYTSSDELVAYWVGVNGISGEPVVTTLSDGGTTVERTLYEGGENESAVVRYKVEGGYHIWFDLTLEGQSTDRILWDFLSQYSLSGLR